MFIISIIIVLFCLSFFPYGAFEYIYIDICAL